MRRRRILISAFQYRLLMVDIAHFGTIVLIFALVVFLPLMLQLRSSTSRSPAEAQELADAFLFLHARLWPALILVLILLAFHSVLISHRIAGPLYRFQRVFRAVAEGDLSVRATIRRRDYLTQEADLVNEMIAALRTRIMAIEDHSTAIRAGIGDLKRTIEGGPGEGVGETLDGLDARMKHLLTCLAQFRTGARAEDGVAPGSVSVVAHRLAKGE